MHTVKGPPVAYAAVTFVRPVMYVLASELPVPHFISPFCIDNMKMRLYYNPHCEKSVKMQQVYAYAANVV